MAHMAGDAFAPRFTTRRPPFTRPPAFSTEDQWDLEAGDWALRTISDMASDNGFEPPRRQHE